MSDRDKTLSKYKECKSILDWINYKQLRNRTVATIRQEKAAYLAYNQNISSKELWKAINKLNIKQKQNTEIPPQLCDTNEINSYFSSVFSPTNNCPDTVNNYNSDKFNNNLSFHFNLATITEVKNVIDNLKSNARGCDDISALMIKYCAPVICQHITHIINYCLEIGFFPNEWKLSIKP